MEKKNLFLIYIMLKLMGLAVFKFDVKLEKLVVCRITTVYSVIIAITLGIFYPFAVIDFAFNFTKSIPSTVTPDIVAFLELAANFFVLILIYRFCIVKRRNLVAILNDFRILRIMFEEEFSTVNVNKSNTQIMIFLKTFVLAVILNICAILSTVMVSNIRYYMVFFLIAPYTTLTTVANMYFSIISIMVFYMKIINYKLKIINFRMKMCFRKTNNDCIYSDQIDKIAVFYHLIHTYTERITKVASGPILIYLLNRYLSVITMIFFQYFMIHNYFVKDIPYDLHISSSGCIYLMFCIVDVVIFICVCASLSFEAKKMAKLLHEIEIQNKDIRFKRSIELLSIQMRNERIEITLYNSLKVGYTMMIDMALSMINYIVILVQFQLSDVGELEYKIEEFELPF